LFVVDIRREHISIREAQILNIRIFALGDTNCDPREVDFAIPSNDDASKSINIILNFITGAIKEGLSERQKEKEVAEVIKQKEENQEPKEDSKVETKDEIKENSSTDEGEVKKKRKRVSKKSEE